MRKEKVKEMKKRKGLNKFINGFGYACSGFLNTFKTELNFRFHFFAAISVLLLGFFLDISLFEWFWVFLAIALVMAVELFNTAIEASTNAISLTFNPYIKKAKDAAAAAVLVVSVFAFLVGVFIFIPKIWELFNW